jgi:hypothetical protein
MMCELEDDRRFGEALVLVERIRTRSLRLVGSTSIAFATSCTTAVHSLPIMHQLNLDYIKALTCWLRLIAWPEHSHVAFRRLRKSGCMGLRRSIFTKTATSRADTSASCSSRFSESISTMQRVATDSAMRRECVMSALTSAFEAPPPSQMSMAALRGRWPTLLAVGDEDLEPFRGEALDFRVLAQTEEEKLEKGPCDRPLVLCIRIKVRTELRES